MKITSFCFFLLFSMTFASAQKFASTQAQLDSIYAKNIKLSKLNGVYIPRNLADAHRRLIKLTPEAALEKFKTGEEKEVCRKLHFGIGKWMILNWNFYEGSRLSHFLRKERILHPDDMAQYILRTFHRSLLEKPLEEDLLKAELAAARKKEADYLLNN